MTQSLNLNNTQLLSNDFELDLSYLKKFSCNDPVFEKDILLSSLEETDEKMQMIHFSIVNNKLSQIKPLAHSLRSLMNIIGAATLCQYFYQIEHYNETNDFEKEVINKFEIIKEKWQYAKLKLGVAIYEYPI